MRKLITTLLASVAVPAMAADLPVKAPVAQPVYSEWTGFYIGVHGGYGWGDESMNADFLRSFPGSNPLSDATCADKQFGVLCLHSPNLRGWVFGGHAGYNWQWSNWVGGLEIDYSAADIKGSSTGVVKLTEGNITETLTHSLSGKVDALASARARLGFLIGRDFLLYGTGGLAWAHKEVNHSFVESITDGRTTFTETLAARSGDNRFGWVAGVGGEYALGGGGWRLRAEFLHYDFREVSVAQTGVATITQTGLPTQTFRFTDSFRDSLSVNVVRGGLSYKF